MLHILRCLKMIVRQKQRRQPSQVADVLHLSDEVFAEVQRVELTKQARTSR